MAAHARYSPSSAARWMNCAGALNAGVGFRDKSSDAANEGTAAHHMAELALLNNTDASDFAGLAAPNGVTMTGEMAAQVQKYVDYVRDFGGELNIEIKVDISKWAHDAFGTADAIIFDGPICHIIDLKYGRGQVFADDNPQLMMYALGVYNEFSFLGIENYVLHIAQPRLDHFDAVEVDEDELLYFGEQVKAAAIAASKPDAPRTAGPTQCKWCPARAVCLERAEYNLKTATDYSGDLAIFDVKNLNMSKEDISTIYPRLDELTRWAKDVKENALEQALEGKKINGYKVVTGRGRNRWRDEELVLEAIRKNGSLKQKELIKQSLITPTQARKLLSERYRHLEHLVQFDEGGPTLAPATDKRPEIAPAIDDIKLFKGSTTTETET